MEVSSVLDRLVDATGGGVCRLASDGTVQDYSQGFAVLAGIRQGSKGRLEVHTLLPGMPALGSLGEAAMPEPPVFTHVGDDGIARELSPALVEGKDREERWLVLVDHSSEARLRRKQRRMGRELEDLQSELRTRENAPLSPQVRTMRKMAASLEAALECGERYRHEVTVLSIQLSDKGPCGIDVSSLILRCVRGVDDVGTDGAGCFCVLLPHTEARGGRIVAERIGAKLLAAGLGGAGIGGAQAKSEERGAALVQRSERACAQSKADGGEVLLAVDVL